MPGILGIHGIVWKSGKTMDRFAYCQVEML